MLPIVTDSGLLYLRPEDRNVHSLCVCIRRALTRGWCAHRDALADPLAFDPDRSEAYQEWLNRLAGEAYRGIDWRPGVLRQLSCDELEGLYLFLVTRDELMC